MLALRAGSLPIEAVIVHWYDNGFHSGTWLNAPSNGILAVEWMHEGNYRTLTYGVDYYVFTPLYFGGVDNYEEVQDLDYKVGLLIDDELYAEFLTSIE
jgi:hypothetical protein